MNSISKKKTVSVWTRLRIYLCFHFISTVSKILFGSIYPLLFQREEEREKKLEYCIYEHYKQQQMIVDFENERNAGLGNNGFGNVGCVGTDKALTSTDFGMMGLGVGSRSMLEASESSHEDNVVYQHNTSRRSVVLNKSRRNTVSSDPNSETDSPQPGSLELANLTFKVSQPSQPTQPSNQNRHQFLDYYDSDDDTDVSRSDEGSVVRYEASVNNVSAPLHFSQGELISASYNWYLHQHQHFASMNMKKTNQNDINLTSFLSTSDISSFHKTWCKMVLNKTRRDNISHPTLALMHVNQLPLFLYRLTGSLKPTLDLQRSLSLVQQVRDSICLKYTHIRESYVMLVKQALDYVTECRNMIPFHLSEYHHSINLLRGVEDDYLKFLEYVAGLLSNTSLNDVSMDRVLLHVVDSLQIPCDGMYVHFLDVLYRLALHTFAKSSLGKEAKDYLVFQQSVRQNIMNIVSTTLWNDDVSNYQLHAKQYLNSHNIPFSVNRSGSNTLNLMNPQANTLTPFSIAHTPIAKFANVTTAAFHVDTSNTSVSPNLNKYDMNPTVGKSVTFTNQEAMETLIDQIPYDDIRLEAIRYNTKAQFPELYDRPYTVNAGLSLRVAKVQRVVRLKHARRAYAVLILIRMYQGKQVAQIKEEEWLNGASLPTEQEYLRWVKHWRDVAETLENCSWRYNSQ